MSKKCIVIVGAGFGGLMAAKSLARHRNLEIILIDRQNYHLFQPLLYQVATAGLSPADIAMPIRSLFSNFPHVRVIFGNVDNIDVQSRIVNLRDGDRFHYDYLILACGAKHSYFGHPEWEKHSPGLKTLEQATEIRRRILLAFELAEKEEIEKLRDQFLTFVIVGAGPTGVELAGAIAEISRSTLSGDFRRIQPEKTKIVLLEAGPRILSAFSEHLSDRAQQDLQRMGVDVRVNTKVTNVDQDGVSIGSENIFSKTVIWAAGVEPSSLGKKLGFELDRIGRVKVQSDLSVSDHPNIFVIGDQAHVPTEDGKGYPGLAAVAMQQGKAAAKNIISDLKGQPRRNFRYRDKGVMATIGRKSAVVQMGSIEFGGFWAWVAWLFVHIYYLIGFKNRLFVFFQWAWSYFTFRRGARLIVDRQWEKSKL